MDDEEYEKLTRADVGLGAADDDEALEQTTPEPQEPPLPHPFEPRPFDDKHCDTCWPLRRREGHPIHG